MGYSTDGRNGMFNRIADYGACFSCDAGVGVGVKSGANMNMNVNLSMNSNVGESGQMRKQRDKTQTNSVL